MYKDNKDNNDSNDSNNKVSYAQLGRSKMDSPVFTALLEPAEEGGYVVTCPELPGLVTEGDTLEEAKEMARDAVQGYLEGLEKDGHAVPSSPRVQFAFKNEHPAFAR
jgi:predicted RNase H-like HicB family nuclease